MLRRTRPASHPDTALVNPESSAVSRDVGRLSILRLAGVGLWLGLVYGLIEGSEFLVLSLVPGALTWRTGNSANIIWVAPIVYGIVFSALAALIGLLLLRSRRVTADIAIVFVLVTGGAFLAATLQGRLVANWAAAILALGIGVEAMRQYRRRRAPLLTLMRQTLPFVGAVTLLLAVLITVGGRVAESVALSRLPSVPAGGANVLLLVLDTQRADHLGSYGYSRPTTPRLDAFAAEGTLFERAYANSSWTLPSHATLLTGQQLHQHRAGMLRRPFLGRQHPTLAEVLRDAGYATGGFVANTYWCGRQTRLNRGFAHYEDFYGNVGDALVRTVLGRGLAYGVLPRFGLRDVPGRKWAAEINGDVLGWIDGLEGKPFFAFVNYFDVHGPLLPPAPYANRFSRHPRVDRGGGKEIDIGALGGRMTVPPREELERLIDRYDESLAYLDAQLGELFDALRERRLLDNTIVIVTADHGESWGEHGMMFHGHSLYHEQLRVPLIVRFPPAVPAGARASDAVGLERIPPTVAQLLSLPDAPFHGPTLTSGDIASRPLAERAVLSEVGRRSSVPAGWPTSYTSLSALLTERWHYIQPDTGRAELYDLVADPQEAVNLAASDSLDTIVRDFQTRLRAGSLTGRTLHGGRSSGR